MYTTELWITEENVIDMLLISCLLQVRTVKEACMFILIKQPSWKRGAVKRLSNNLNG
uniref:Uncharacterized protein n=1 Tax=Ciona savignyi TaxID=51511 RepID=H2YXW2_CIOSA